MKKQRLAVFDIDGTIFRFSLNVELILQLIKDEVFPRRVLLDMEDDYKAWVNRHGSYETYIGKTVQTYVGNIKGVAKKDLDRAVDIVISKRKNKLYRFTRDYAKQLKEEGCYLLTISNSNVEMVASFAEFLGFDGHYGTVYEVKRGKYTGNILNPEILTDKGAVLTAFLKQSKIKFDLKNSVAVGDTHSDIPMLEMVGHPVAFNPNKNLAEYAKKKKWTTIIERKDVIYELKNYSFKNS